MSSNEDDLNDGDTPINRGLKKRRIQRACDTCRRKKIRCDGVQMPGNQCSNCVSYSLECTYVEASKKRGPPKGYVESLENRVEKLNKLLRKLVPDATLVKELQDAMDKEWVPLDPSPLVATQQQPTFFHTSSPNTLTPSNDGTKVNIAPPDDLVEGDAGVSRLTDDFGEMGIIEPDQSRFFGTSSPNILLQTAIDLKKEYTKSAEPSSKESITPKSPKAKIWGLQDWELKSDLPSLQYAFPEADLASDLVDLYFSNINMYHPLLHRPTFEKSIAEGLHFRDERFASTYLLVCAVGSRFSDDRRVLLDEFDTRHSCGWKWFNQVQIVKRSFPSPPTLYDLQFYCLAVHFLQGTSEPQSCWIMAGLGIRLAHDVGAHQRKEHQQTLTAENEQWNRAFWVLVCMDRMISASLGRPCAIHDEISDVDLPVDCDDEYWDHPDPEQRFKQPENKPSLISAFIRFIKLNQILSKCLAIYAIKQSKILLGYVRQQWEQDIVAQLDSALNQWVDTIPDHLRWDPNRQNLDFFNQSACFHIADIMRRKNPMPPVQAGIAIFTAGIVLLLNIWGGKRSGLSVDPNKEMTDVHKCIKILMVIEERWHSVEGLRRILCELTSAGNLPLPESSPMSINKRERDCDTPISASSSESPQPAIQGDTPRIIAGSLRASKDRSVPRLTKRTDQLHHHSNQQQRQPNHNQQHPDYSTTVPSTPTYTLPLYSDELSQLPLHGRLDFSAPYLDQGNYWYPNSGSAVDGSEGNVNSDHTVLSNISSPSSLPHHSNRRQHQQQVQDHNHVQSSYNNNTNNYPLTAETSTMTQGSSHHSHHSNHRQHQQTQNHDHNQPSHNNTNNYLHIADTSTMTQKSSHHSNRRQHQQAQDNQPSHNNTNNYLYTAQTSTITHGSSHHSNRRQHQQAQDHNHIQSFHNNSNNYLHTAETNTVAQGFPLNPTMGSGNVMFDPLSTYTPPGSVSSPQNPLGLRGRSSYPSFRGVSMALRGDLGGVVDQRQKSSQPQPPSHLEQPPHQLLHHQMQGQREHHVHDNHHHREQQQLQHPMDYSYVDNDTMAIWSTAPTGFELDEWSTYLSNMMVPGGHGGGAQMQIQEQR